MSQDLKTAPQSIELASSLVAAIESARIDVTSEHRAHDGIEAVISALVGVEREVLLGDLGRIDLLAGRVGIEVKARGDRRRAILRQLKRYSLSDRIDVLILATASPWPTRVATLNGKPLLTASLSMGWL